jgi:hypothetical protein
LLGLSQEAITAWYVARPVFLLTDFRVFDWRIALKNLFWHNNFLSRAAAG